MRYKITIEQDGEVLKQIESESIAVTAYVPNVEHAVQGIDGAIFGTHEHLARALLVLLTQALEADIIDAQALIFALRMYSADVDKIRAEIRGLLEDVDKEATSPLN